MPKPSTLTKPNEETSSTSQSSSDDSDSDPSRQTSRNLQKSIETTSKLSLIDSYNEENTKEESEIESLLSLIGPTYDHKSVATILKISSDGLDFLRKEHRVIGFKSNLNKKYIYPIFQFPPYSSITNEEQSKITRELSKNIPKNLKKIEESYCAHRAIAIWMNQENSELGDLTPLDYLSKTGSVDSILEVITFSEVS